MNEKLIDFDEYAEVKLTEYLFRLDKRRTGCTVAYCTSESPYTYWLTSPEIEVRLKIWPPLRNYIDLLIHINAEQKKQNALLPDEEKTDVIVDLLAKHTQEAQEQLELHKKEKKYE